MSTSHFKLSIPKPCPEEWNAMTPSGIGRHCSSCKKNVIDFSILSDTEIQNYFIKNQGQVVCGHFRNTQLERIRIQLPNYFFEKKIPLWQKYLIVILFCFGNNLYSIDISVGNKNGLNAQTIQTEVSKSHTNRSSLKKKKLKVKKIKNETTLILKEFTETELWTTGLTIPIKLRSGPDPEIVNLKSLSTDTVEKKDTSTVTINSSNETSKREPVPEKKEKNGSEFILPPPFRIRKRKWN